MSAEFWIVSCAWSAKRLEKYMEWGLTVTSETLFMENPGQELPCERCDCSLLPITAAVCAGDDCNYDVET